MDPSYDQMPAPAPSAAAGAILGAFIDSAAYRFRWSVEGMRNVHMDFRPAAGCMDLRGLVSHLFQLASRVRGALDPESPALRQEEPGDDGAPDAWIQALRVQTLRELESAAGAARSMDTGALDQVRVARGITGETLPVWNLIHGPIADFLTHVGQINTWRRIAGFPAPSPRVFLGLPPDPASVEAESEDGSIPMTVVDADLHGSVFRDVTLSGATFDDVNLAGSRFQNVTLAGSTIVDADLSQVTLRDVNVDGMTIDGVSVSDKLDR